MIALRRFAPLAPLAGTMVAAAAYGLDPSFEGGFSSPNWWSTYGAVAGWCILLAGLLFVASNQVSRWMAFFAAFGFVVGPSNSGGTATFLFGLGFVMTGAVILVASATHVVTTYGTRGRIAGAAVLTASGAASLLSFGFPDSRYLDNPATQVWAALVMTPLTLACASLWLWLDRAPGPEIAKVGSPASLPRRVASGAVSWVIFGVISSLLASVAGGVIGPFTYPICVVLLQVAPTAIWGRTVGQISTGLRVVRVDTAGPPGWLRSIVRFAVFQAIPLLGIIYLATWASSLRMGLGRGVPDRLAWDRGSGTAVLRVVRP